MLFGTGYKIQFNPSLLKWMLHQGSLYAAIMHEVSHAYLQHPPNDPLNMHSPENEFHADLTSIVDTITNNFESGITSSLSLADFFKIVASTGSLGGNTHPYHVCRCNVIQAAVYIIASNAWVQLTYRDLNTLSSERASSTRYGRVENLGNCWWVTTILGTWANLFGNGTAQTIKGKPDFRIQWANQHKPIDVVRNNSDLELLVNPLLHQQAVTEGKDANVIRQDPYASIKTSFFQTYARIMGNQTN